MTASDSKFQQKHPNGALKNPLGVLAAKKNTGPPGGPAHVFFAATPQVRY
jgi:hypothetical protein